ncbi:MAG: M35 family metallo-endopeptidase [Acidobacteriota bacterium]
MIHVKDVKKWLLVAAAAVCGASSAQAAGVSATIEADRTFLADADPAVVRVAIHNDSTRDLYVLRWQTPLNGVQENLFDVRLDGKAVDYTGRLYKRSAPRAEDYVRIPAGGQIGAEVDLSSVYDMSRTGEYTVRFRANVQDALSGVGTRIADASLREISSNVLSLGVERDERSRAVQQMALGSDEDHGIRSTTGNYLTPSYVSCSSTRQSTLVSALSNAQTISLRARDYLNNLPSTSRSTDAAYKTWFGTYTSSRYSTVQSHYNNIYSTFTTKTVTFYCDCTDSSYAYVYANQPYKIHLCSAFWAAPMTGIDSKAGTLVHETSHFTVVAGTQDYAYGQSACKSLAISSPSSAVMNADSHEYFAETR